jgi:hypothetical protein
MPYTYDDMSVSDLHKDAFGFRPSETFWQEWELSNPDARQQIWDDLIRALQWANENAYDDSMDGDEATALASAGWGTDEDYSGTPDYDW